MTKGSDVIGVTETWLKCDDEVDRFCPQGYVVYRADRPDGRIGGGVMLLIAQQYHQTQGPSLRSPSVQAISCALSVHRKKIMIAVIYRSPVSEKDEDESLVQYLKTLSASADNVLILGDFNAPEVDWNLDSAPGKSFGKMVLDFLCTESLIQHVGEPTRRRGEQTPSILDLIITKFANDVDRLQFLSPVGKSDHALLTFSLNLRGSLPPDRYMRRYGKLNKVALLREAKEINWRSYDLADGIEDRWLAIKGAL